MIGALLSLESFGRAWGVILIRWVLMRRGQRREGVS